mgnify:CR=1 FL=1
MGSHLIDLPFWALELQSPTTVEAEGPLPVRAETYPDYLTVRWEHPARGKRAPVKLTWYDGKQRPKSPEGVDLQTWHKGIMFVGDQGRVFVNRGKAYGKPVEELRESPLPADAVRLYKSDDHMGNFFECVKTRKAPAATVAVAHRVLTACHLGNIAVRLRRKIVWDAAKEEIVGDAEAANSIYVRRPQRAPYQVG